MRVKQLKEKEPVHVLNRPGSEDGQRKRGQSR